MYDPANYTFERFENCWVGEQGKKLSTAFIGKDDFIHVSPAFPTSFYNFDAGSSCTFDDITDTSAYIPENMENNIGRTSLHYSYGLYHLKNNNADKGKILMLCDSYANVCEPFLALGVSEIVPQILRSTGLSVPSMLELEDYDTVLVCYAQFMIGAHDDEDSANYRMFDFMGKG